MTESQKADCISQNPKLVIIESAQFIQREDWDSQCPSQYIMRPLSYPKLTPSHCRLKVFISPLWTSGCLSVQEY